MKVTVKEGNTIIAPRAELARVLKLCGMVAVNKGARPILGYVHIVKHGLDMRFQVTNLDTYLQYDAEYPGDDEFEVLVNVDTLNNAINDSRADMVHIKPRLHGDGLGCTVELWHGEKRLSSTNINGADIRDFPAENMTSVESADIECEALRKAIKAVEPAVAKQAVQYAMTGVSMSCANAGNIELAGTDTHRLHVAVVQGQINGPDAVVMLSGLRVIAEACAMSTRPGHIQVEEEAKNITFQTGPIIVRTQCIQGRFPQYRNIVTPILEHETYIDFGRDDLLACTKRAGAFAEERDRSVSLRKDVESGFVIRSENESGQDLSYIETGGDVDVDLTYCTQYIIDALGCIDTDVVRMMYKDSRSPFALTGDPSFAAVIMPVAKG